MSKPGFIVLVESYLIRKGMVALLNRIPDIRIAGEFSDATSFQHFVHRQSVDFLVIGQSMFDHLSDLFVSQPGVLEKTILLIEDPAGMPEIYRSISLSDSKEEITSKIKNLLDLHASSVPEESSQKLTLREKTIVRWVSLGFTNRQIADELFLSTHTVMTHRKNISGKLGIKSVSGLTVYAIVNNIITIEEVTSKPT